MIIGIAGKSGSGKDTLAAHLVAAHGFRRRAFADALKLKWLAQLGERGVYTGYKTEEDAIAAVTKLKEISAIARGELQEIGQAERAKDPEYWITRVWGWQSAHGVENLVIPDVRYRNEAGAIRARSGIVIRVERPGHENRLTPEQREHASECELDDYEDFDMIIENRGAVEELYSAIDFLLQHAWVLA